MGKFSRRKMIRLGVLAPMALPGLGNLHIVNRELRNKSTDGNNEPIKRIIPSSGEKITAIGLGTWRTFDAGNSQAARSPLKEVLKKLAEKNGSIIDSSPMYGSSEEVVGDLTEELKLRNKFFLATKVWTTGRKAGIDQMNASFSKMRTSKVDLMQVHNLVDASTQIKTLKEWKDAGKIRYWGITHYVRSAIPSLMKIVKDEKPDFVQFSYSIDNREAENELLPACNDKGVAVIINRPFREGGLFGDVNGKNLPPWTKEFAINNWAQFFLKFIISHPYVTCAIPGTSNPDHMEENIGAAYGKLPDATTRKRMISFFEGL